MTTSEPRERVFGVCPVHAPARGECWDGCLPERMEFRQIARALNVYWFDRARGMPPRRPVRPVSA